MAKGASPWIKGRDPIAKSRWGDRSAGLSELVGSRLLPYGRTHRAEKLEPFGASVATPSENLMIYALLPFVVAVQDE
jgi:hypothetical protein